MLTRTASIGIAVLKSAIGLSRNYKAPRVESWMDLEHPGCRECHCFKESGAEYCQDDFPFSSECFSCIYHFMGTRTRTVYVNEKNRFGARHCLQKNALLLFIYLHYLNPDKNGLVAMDLEDAVGALGCTERTVRNNLDLLAKWGYIAMTKVCAGCYKIFLSEYKTYFKQSREGGRGYAVLPVEHFEALVKMPDINSLRLAVRSLLPDTLIKRAKRGMRPYFVVQGYLPRYCTKPRVKKLVSTPQFQAMFDVTPKKYEINIQAKDKYDIDNIASIYKAECRNAILKLIEKWGKRAKELRDAIGDISAIALRVPIKYIEIAVQRVWDVYISSGMNVGSVGALVRTIATDLYEAA